MKINSLEDLRKWVIDGPGNRHVEVEIGGPGNEKEFEIWVYDYNLMMGQYINIPGEITFYDRAESEIDKQIEALYKRKEILNDNNK